MKNECGLRCVKLENVGVKRGKNILIKDVSFDLRCGKITAIIGANGAGKTTLLRAILGDVKHSGKILFEDHNHNVVNRIKIGYVPQKLDFDTSSAVSVMDLFTAVRYNSPAFLYQYKKNRESIKLKLKQYGCDHLSNRRLGELSGGELQKVMLALALDPVPELLVLDEPVSGVDVKGLEQFYSTVSLLRTKYHMAIVLVSHDLRLVEKYADEVALINNQSAIYGKPKDIYKTPEFEKTFGIINGGERQ